MDNIENYLYVLFAVIYIISRIIKARNKQAKSKQPQQTQKQSPLGQQPRAVQPQNQQRPKKTFSFEDILKEFEKNLAGPEEEEYAHERPLPVEEIRHEKPTPVPVKPAETTPNPYQSYTGSSAKTIKEEIELESKTTFVRSDNYVLKENVASEYIKMLQDPQGFKNAIVLSEIINKKYF